MDVSTHSGERGTRDVCKFSSKTAQKGRGQLHKFLNNATSIIRQSVDHGSTSYTKGKYTAQISPGVSQNGC